MSGEKGKGKEKREESVSGGSHSDSIPVASSALMWLLNSSRACSARRRTPPPPHRPLGNFAPPVSASSARASLHRSKRTVRLACRSWFPSPSSRPSATSSSSNSEREQSKRTLPERKAPRSSTRVSESRLSARPVRIVFVVVVKMLARSRRGEEVRR